MKDYGKTRLVSYSVAALSLFTRATPIKRRCVKRQIPVRNNGAVAVLLGLVVGTARLASAQYDPLVQFSPSSNPNGLWSYGFISLPLGSPFNLLTLPTIVGTGVNAWVSPSFGGIGVLYNGTATIQTVTDPEDNAIYQPGMLAMHPGPNNEYAIVQFTVPTSGIYTFQGWFEGIDTSGTTTDVHLLVNNVDAAGNSVIGYGTSSERWVAFGPRFYNAGDTLAYAVGSGANGPAFDTTALIYAQILAVPEPSPYALLGLALVPLAVRAGFARKRKAAT